NDDIIIQDENIIRNIDIVLCLDSSDIERSYATKKIIESSNIVINIDHHKTNDSFGDINLVLPDCSSTCEIILKLSKIGYLPLTPGIADCLLTGIFTDTGFFRNQNVSDTTFDASAELIRFGADHENLITRLLQSKTVEQLLFHSEAVTSSEFSLKKEVGWISIDRKMQEKYEFENPKEVWATGIIGFLQNIYNIKASFYFIEVSDEETIVEYRCKNPYDVSIIAKHFGGGGHKLASGCTIYHNIEETRSMVLDYFFRNYPLA
ncbi:MAG: DHH family phosphoesterase, partial [Candidatus Muiribacteriaceae bacterium]